MGQGHQELQEALARGTSGSSGTSGINGASGTAGSSGSSGTSGTSGSGSGYVVTNVTTTYTATATTGSQIVLCNTTGGAFTVTLPTAVGNNATITIKKTAGTPNLTVDGNASETIDGGLTATIVAVYESITIISDNANWWII